MVHTTPFLNKRRKVMITKAELLQEANLALENNACLLLKAGDYFTDYAKIVLPHSVNNFIDEIECFGTDIGWDEDLHVAVHSVDIIHCGTKEKNEYYIRGARAILREEVDVLFELVGL